VQAADGTAVSTIQIALQNLLHPSGPTEHLGRQLWRSIPHAFVLTQQHRGAATLPGQHLYASTELFNGIDGASYDQLEQLCDLYNRHAIPSVALLPEPYVVVLRHAVRLPLLQRLLPLHADTRGQQLLVWRSSDLEPDGTPLPPALYQQLEALGGPQDDGGFPTIGAFFAGIRYIFTTNAHTSLQHIHNNCATGTGIVLHPAEPPIPPPDTAPIHVLTYMPRAVFVIPDGRPRGRISRIPEVAEDEIAVLPKAHTFTPLHAIDRRPIHRWGFPLDLAYAVTDYFAEGTSFRGQNWLAHLSRPPDGRLHRASLYVIPTRFSSLDDFHLLCPLWPHGDDAEKERMLQKPLRLAQPVPDLKAEWQRLLDLAELTRLQLQHLHQRLS
jgi:hypothetical protein